MDYDTFQRFMDSDRETSDSDSSSDMEESEASKFTGEGDEFPRSVSMAKLVSTWKQRLGR